VCGTYLGTNATAFAVFKVYLDKRRLADNGFRAIEPALKTGWFVQSGGGAFLPVYYGAETAPFPSPTRFTNGWT